MASDRSRISILFSRCFPTISDRAGDAVRCPQEGEACRAARAGSDGASPSRRPDTISGFVNQRAAFDGAVVLVGCSPSTGGGPRPALGATEAPYEPPPRRRRVLRQIARPDFPRRSVNLCSRSDPRSVVIRGCEATGSSAMMLGVGIRRGRAPGERSRGPAPPKATQGFKDRET